MTTIEYIYDFLHDPYRDRWPERTVEYLLSQAELDLTDKATSFIALRAINREKAFLEKQEVTRHTREVQLVEGQDIYNLGVDYIRITSVIYNNCFIAHSVDKCDTDCEEPVRSYNVQGLPKGSIKISPIPTTQVCMGTPEETCTIVDITRERVVDDYSTLGWGFVTQAKATVTYDTVCTDVTPEQPVEEITLGKLLVTYELKEQLTYEDDTAEIIQKLAADAQLQKYYVCGHLLREDRDAQSRTLGIEELTLFDKRVSEILDTYSELFITDDILNVASKQEGYVDTGFNTIVKTDSAETSQIEAARLATEEQEERYKYRKTKKSKFDILPVRGGYYE